MSIENETPEGEEARDAARLDWLIGHIWVDEIGELPLIPSTDSVEDHRRNVRAAIDASMSASKEGASD